MIHGKKERKRKRRIIIIIIIIRNGAKTISLQTLFGRLINVNKFYILIDQSNLTIMLTASVA
jgi:septum formation topological specificity factor MinE